MQLVDSRLFFNDFHKLFPSWFAHHRFPSPLPVGAGRQKLFGGAAGSMANGIQGWPVLLEEGQARVVREPELGKGGK